MIEMITTSDIRKHITILNRTVNADLIVSKLDKPRFVVINYEKYKLIEECINKINLDKQQEFKKSINMKIKNGYQRSFGNLL